MNYLQQRIFSVILFLTAVILSANDLEDSLMFHAPLDGAVNAILAEGEYGGNALGALRFTEGLGGSQALLCGEEGATVLYMREENVDFDNPGTITLWFKIDCEHGEQGPGIVFIGIGGDIDRGRLALQVVNDPMDICPCRRQIGFMLFSKKRRHRDYMVGTGERRICSGWHLLSGGWAGNRLFVSLDGTPYKSFELPYPISNREFDYTSKFSLGLNYTKWKYAIADFRIYGKHLSDADIKNIYDEGMSKRK